MTLRHLSDLKAPIGKVIEGAGNDGILIEAKGRPAYAMIPLDDDLLDYLLERNPALIEECARIRERMRKGEFHSHDEVKRMLKA
jgi:hypothetical protein